MKEVAGHHLSLGRVQGTQRPVPAGVVYLFLQSRPQTPSTHITLLAQQLGNKETAAHVQQTKQTPDREEPQVVSGRLNHHTKCEREALSTAFWRGEVLPTAFWGRGSITHSVLGEGEALPTVFWREKHYLQRSRRGKALSTAFWRVKITYSILDGEALPTVFWSGKPYLQCSGGG